MPLKIFFLPSYERCLKSLGHREQQIAGFVVMALEKYFQSGTTASHEPYVFEYHKRAYRLVFKKLRHDLWEAYVEKQVRLLMQRHGNGHYLIFAGNHDSVRKFLKND